MKNQYLINITRIDNGLLIQGGSDDGQRHKKSAANEAEAQKLLHDLIDHMFEVPEKKTQATAKP